MDDCNETNYAEEVANSMAFLYKRDLTTTSGGNISMKDEDGTIWMTPSVWIIHEY